MKLSQIEVTILEKELKSDYPSLAINTAILNGSSSCSYNELVKSRDESEMTRWEYNATLILFYLAAHDSAEE